jgi:hypothetical protein
VAAEFAPLAEATAREHGFDGLPLAVVPQSFERLTREGVAAAAANVADELIRLLTTPADELQAEFSDRWGTGGGVAVSCSIPVRLGKR